MPKAQTAKMCHVCEGEDRVKMTFMVCAVCHRHFCSNHGVPDLDQCSTCLEAREETE
jgi:hypothetical protein